MDREDSILYDCLTCRLYPCFEQKQPNAEKVIKGSCFGYKCDIDKVTKEIIKIAENENNKRT